MRTLFIFICLKGIKTEEIDREIFLLIQTPNPTQTPATPGLHLQFCRFRADDRSPDLNLGLQNGWQGPRNLSHYLLSPRVQVSRKLEPEEESGFKNQGL